MMGIFIVFTVDVVAANKAYNEVSTNRRIRPIDLEGHFESPGQMRSDVIFMAPITAEQQGDMLLVHFQETVGVVQVIITDKWGDSVFTETIDAAMQPSLTISLAGLPSGSYVITFSNENGELRGEFKI